MIIAIDGYEANVKERVGIGRYAFEILWHIYALLSQNSKLKTQNSIRVYLPSPPFSDMPGEASWWRYRIAKPRKPWTFIGLPLALATDIPKPAVVFSPTHYIPRFINAPRVMAIMDLSYLEYPQMFLPKDLHQLIHWTAYSVKHAKKIFTISEFSKNVIIKAYNVPGERVVVTYPGLAKMTNPTNLQITNVLEKYRIDKPYILSVGTIQPRKNFVRLIEAFAKGLDKLSEAYPDISLVIVGKKGWLYQDTLEAPTRFNIEDRVKFLDFVPDKDLSALYWGALCFALPSLYEGFGLPVLEAMAHQCPVVVSRVSSLPEIAGESGIYVDPNSVEDILRGLLEAVSVRGTKAGDERIAKGLAQVKKFSWDKAAKLTLDILLKVGEGKL